MYTYFMARGVDAQTFINSSLLNKFQQCSIAASPCSPLHYGWCLAFLSREDFRSFFPIWVVLCAHPTVNNG